MSAIIGAYLLVAPILASDTPPFAGTARVERIAQTIDQTQKLLDQTAQTLRRLSQNQDQADLDAWNGRLELAEARLKANPGDELAKLMIRTARDQISMLTARIASGGR